MQFNSPSDKIIFFILFLFSVFWLLIIPLKLYFERKKQAEKQIFNPSFFLSGPLLFLFYLVFIAGAPFLEKVHRRQAEERVRPMIERASHKDRERTADSAYLDGPYIIYQLNESICAPKGILFWVAGPGLLSYRVSAKGLIRKPWKEYRAIRYIVFIRPSVMMREPVDEVMLADSLLGIPVKPGTKKAGILMTEYTIETWFYNVRDGSFFFSEVMTSQARDAGPGNLYERLFHRLSDLYESGTRNE